MISSIILAAGQGTRMQSSIPKVMHKLAGLPMIDYLLESLSSLSNLKECVVVLGPEMESVSAHVLTKRPDAKFAVQENRLGTADAVKIGVSHLKDSDQDTLILYGDAPFTSAASIKDMKAALLENYSKTALVLLGFLPKNLGAYGRLVINSHGELQKIVEYLDGTEDQKKISICNQGTMLINKLHRDRLLSRVSNDNAKKEFYLTDLIDIAVQSGLTCRYLLVDEREAMAINTRTELAQAEKELQNNLRQKFLLAGVTLTDPSTVYFSGDTYIDEDVTIQPNVFIGPGVVIRSGAKIKAFSHVEGAEIGKNVTVGPFARIRPGTKLDENVRVGNFVEIKNSSVSKQTKINHLAYIGDTTIGASVNIGAGTIVCNYDGVAKHNTTIKDETFVGSNVTLVAPVVIGPQSIIAAGSVITKGVAKNELAIARAEQKNIPDKASEVWHKKRKNSTL